MALADMLFVDALKQSGVEYDFGKRRIYPLFCALGIDLSKFSGAQDPEFIKNLKIIVHANYRYCVRGDDSEYKKLLEGMSLFYHPFPNSLVLNSIYSTTFFD